MLAPFTNLTDAQRRFREQLGLSVDRPIIMTGHQAQFWHPGILAKYLAVDAAARALRAAPAWLVVDQDDNEPGAVRYPILEPNGRLRARTWYSLGETPRNAVTGLLSPSPPTTPPDDVNLAAGSVAPGLQRISEALGASTGEVTAARQVAAALSLLLRPLASAATTIFALSLARTDEFRAIVERMRHDPRACTLAYNDAAARHPHARIRPLGTGLSANHELPLWKFEGTRRIPVYSDELPGLAVEGLAPRALLMTGLLRSGACDLFVHGTGGGGADAGAGYEAITDDWFRAWLGAPPPAPVAVVTATVRLPIKLPTDPGTPDEVSGAISAAHRARHDPALLGDAAAADRKREFVARIASMKNAGEDPGPVYRQMHALLEAVRDARAADLARLDAQAAAGAARLSDSMILADRTWPFPLYPDAMLQDLKSRIDAAFGL